jgi:hypothetical protein
MPVRITADDGFVNLWKNLVFLPEKLIGAVQNSDLDPKVKEVVIRDLRIARPSGQGYLMKNEIVYGDIDVFTILSALVHGSAELNIKPQINLKDLLLK